MKSRAEKGRKLSSHSPKSRLAYRAIVRRYYRDVQLSNHPFQSQKKAQAADWTWTTGRTRGENENTHEMSVCLGGSLSWRKGGGGAERNGCFVC